MTKREKQELSRSLEASYSQELLERFCRQAGCGGNASLFASASAADAAEELSKKRLRRRLLEEIPRALRIRFLEILSGESLEEEESLDFREEAGAVGILLQSGTTPIAPELGKLLLADVDVSYCATDAPEDTSRLFSLEDELPALFEQPSDADNLPGSLPRELYPADPQALIALLKLFSIDLDEEEATPARSAESIRDFDGGMGDAWTQALLPHLHARSHPAPPQERRGEIWTLLLSLLKSVGDEWIDARGFAVLLASRMEAAAYIDEDYAADYLYFESRSSYRNYLGDSGRREEQCYLDTPARLRDACLIPLVFGGLGLLYLLGALELEYMPEKRRFTPWEGIGRFRLSTFGSYLFHPDKPAPVWKGTAPIQLAKEGELARIEGHSTRAGKLLQRIGAPVAPGCYRITPASLFTACPDPESLETALELLRRLSMEPIPPAWERLFSDLDSRRFSLKPEAGYQIFTLEADRNFLELLLRREELRGLYLKVEGGRLAVRDDDMERFLKELRSAGYLLNLQKKEDPPR